MVVVMWVLLQGLLQKHVDSVDEIVLPVNVNRFTNIRGLPLKVDIAPNPRTIFMCIHEAGNSAWCLLKAMHLRFGLGVCIYGKALCHRHSLRMSYLLHGIIWFFVFTRIKLLWLFNNLYFRLEIQTNIKIDEFLDIFLPEWLHCVCSKYQTKRPIVSTYKQMSKENCIITILSSNSLNNNFNKKKTECE